MIEDKIKCLLVEPNKLPKEIEIKKELKSYQKMVGGLIEQAYLPFDDDVVIICNEEGKINNMELNRDIGHDIIAGPFLIVGDDYDNADFKSLTEDQILKYKMIFDKNSITRTRNKINAILLSQSHKRFERERDR
jgi:hypothetical protein